MNIQSTMGTGVFCLFALYTSSVLADAALTGPPVIDTTTHGSWMNTYGSCYSVVPQASPRHRIPEVEIGPLFEGTHPEQYQNPPEGDWDDAVCIRGAETSNFDVRIFTVGSNNAYAWGFDEHDCVPSVSDPCAYKVLQGTAQDNACRGYPYPSTFDNEDYSLDPLSGELKLTQGGDATIAYYFLSEADNCRSQDYVLSVNGVPVPGGAGTVDDISNGTYVVFDLIDIPDGALVRLDVTMADPSCASAQGQAYNSHLSGIFVDGTEACAPPPPEAPSRTLGYWKNHPTVINGDFGGAPSLLPLEFCGKVIDDACDAVYFLKKGGGGKKKFMRQGMAALLNCTAFGCPTEISDLIAEASEACGNGDSYKYGKAGGILGDFNEANDNLPLPFQSPSALPKYCN